MAPTARTSLSLPEYSRRERKAIVLLTLGFIVLSALVHMGIASIYRPMPPVANATPQPHESMIISIETPSPRPTLPPTPTPAPRAQPSAPPRPQAHPSPNTSTTSPAPPVHPPTRPTGDGTSRPIAYATRGPGQVPATDTPATEVPSQPLSPCRMVRKIKPDYPDALKEAGIQGTVVVIVSIGPDGGVRSIRVGESSGNAMLDSAALAAARASTYACPPVQGRPEADLYQVIYTFQIDSN